MGISSISRKDQSPQITVNKLHWSFSSLSSDRFEMSFSEFNENSNSFSCD